MPNKNQIYAQQIEPLVQKITAICIENGLPMLISVCVELEKSDDGTYDMTIAGSTHLSGHDIDPPGPMLLAATILRVPGFEGLTKAFLGGNEEKVH